MVQSGTVYGVGLNLGPATLHMAREGHWSAMISHQLASTSWKSTEWNLCKIGWTQNRRKSKISTRPIVGNYDEVHIKRTCLEVTGNCSRVHIKQTCLKTQLELCSQALTRPTQGLAGTSTLGQPPGQRWRACFSWRQWKVYLYVRDGRNEAGTYH